MPRRVDPVMTDRRAASFTRRSIKTASKMQAIRLAVSMIDLTTLEGADTPGRVRALCRRALQPCSGGGVDTPGASDAPGASDSPGVEPLPAVAAVCVYPALVPTAVEALWGTGVRVASVATAFPSGQLSLANRVAEVHEAVDAGADEIDMVINRGAFLAGRFDVVAEEIREIRAACGEAHLKIILETGELGTYDAIRRASDLAIEAAPPKEDGEIFIKTSTGKIGSAATMPVTLIMLEAIRDHYRATGVRVGMKPAGGIRDAKLAIHYLVMVRETLGPAWLSPHLFRFGASSLLDDLVRQWLRQVHGPYAAAYDVPDA